MAKFSAETKSNIVKRVLECSESVTALAQEYGVNRSEIKQWVAIYEAHGEAGLAKRRGSYSGDFKLAVVEDMRVNGLAYRETAVKYNLGSHHVVEKWERIFLEEGAAGLYIERRGQGCGNPRKGRPPKMEKKVEEDLIAENQRLRMENEYLKKLNALVQERQLQEKKRK